MSTTEKILQTISSWHWGELIVECSRQGLGGHPGLQHNMDDVSRSLSDVAVTFHDNWVWICVTLCWQVIDLVGIFISLRTCELWVGVASFRLPAFDFYISAFWPSCYYCKTCISNILYNLQYIALSYSIDLYPLSVVFSASVPPCHAGCRPQREKPNIGGSFYNTVAD